LNNCKLPTKIKYFDFGNFPQILIKFTLKNNIFVTFNANELISINLNPIQMKNLLFITILTVFAFSCQVEKPKPWEQLSLPTVLELTDQFQYPAPDYGPSLIIGWNGSVNEEVIMCDLDTAQSMGFKSFTIEAIKWNTSIYPKGGLIW